ncbi:MAG: archaeal cell division control protein 6 [archaeon GW2011_AR3]|nr:MAG: archaeal cell division control protein 6 [archaeon GW2011_AR3]MBS3109408.1 ORC1-type DNA replication protein [Candidatus Woesearchaeota archaeon]
MAQRGLSIFFENFLKKQSLFANKKAIQTTYMPESISHRDSQIQQLANILAPSLKLETPSNVFVYGKTGTGKTLCVKYVSEQISQVAKKQEIPVKILYINCKMKKIADTEYRLIAQLAREFGKAIPATGLPTDEVYKAFFNAIDGQRQSVIIVLDEIDQLIKKSGDEILYNLTRANSEFNNSHISIVGISNDLLFADNLDPRIKSSLSEEEVTFAPYNAVQLQQILKQRGKEAFKENVLGEGTIEKCSAFAAWEHGDARRALDLLRVAGEVAEREGSQTVEITHVDQAEEKLEKERVLEITATQPRQTQTLLYSIVALSPKENQTIFTGEVYEIYKKLCFKTNIRPLTIRRISDIIAELDMQGIISTRTISKGRYGRTREISLSIPHHLKGNMEKLLKEALEIQDG